jgi:putative copper export protein
VEWIVARWLTFVATFLIAGACAVGLALLPRARSDNTTALDIARDTAQLGLIAVALLIPASMLRLTDQLLALRSPGDAVTATLTALLASTTWGTGFLWHTASLLVAGIGLLLVARAPDSISRWCIAAVGAIGLCVTPALQGHAIGTEERTAIAVAADIAHVVGGAMWLGTIGVVAWLGLALHNADGEVSVERATRAAARIRLLVPLIPPVALPGAALLIASGVIASWLHLRTLDDLWRDAWGRYVLAKAIAATIIVALGALNWQRLGRRLKEASGVVSLRRALTAELLLALLILVITAILVVTPLPGESDEASARRHESAYFAAGLPMPSIFDVAPPCQWQQRSGSTKRHTWGCSSNSLRKSSGLSSVNNL